MKRAIATLWVSGLVLLSCSSKSGSQMQQLTDAFTALESYKSTHGALDRGEASRLVDEVDQAADAVLAESTSTEEQRQKAYEHARFALLIGVAVDEKKYEAKLQKSLEQGIRAFPDSKLAKDNERVLFQKFPIQFTGETLDGRSLDIQNYRGSVVLIDFWATWCPYCRSMTPELQKLYRKYQCHGLEIVGFSLDNREADLKKYLAENPKPWPQVFLKSASSRSAMLDRAGISGLPSLIVLDPQGRVKGEAVHGLQQAELKILELLKPTLDPRRPGVCN